MERSSTFWLDARTGAQTGVRLDVRCETVFFSENWSLANFGDTPISGPAT